MQGFTEEQRHQMQTETLTRFIGLLINVAVEECGEKILDKFEQAFYEVGTKLGKAILPVVGMPEGEPDAIALSRLVDYADTIMGYEWEYVEKTPKRAAKKIPACPLAKPLSKGYAPEFCSRFMVAWGTALMRTANPKARCTFTHYIPKGDEYCMGIFEVED
ncbi:MAG: hypothetical protein KKB20_29785 [Proteobacteria bacterium]|nr:hypothetical protein [Pseudomonadota bacterium]